MRKKGITPIISTVLLIMIVVILAIIILLWSRGFVREAILKEIAGQEKTIDKYCIEVQLETFVDPDGTFGFKNIGNVPLYSYNLKLTQAGSSFLDERATIVNPGGSARIGDLTYSSYDKVEVIPILLGKKKTGENQEFTCPDRNSIPIK